MNCVQRLAVLTFTAISLLGLSGCSSLSTMTKDEAIEKDKKDQVYDSHASLANNIAVTYPLSALKTLPLQRNSSKKPSALMPVLIPVWK